MKGECFESALEFGGGVVAVCFCFLGGAGASQLPGCEGEGGPVSFGVVFCGAVKGECFESALEFGGGVIAVCFCFGGGGRGPVSFRAVKGKGGQSALELCSSSVFVLRGAGGPVGDVKGECFESALEFGGWCRRRLFLFWGGGGRGAVSFRAVKGKGGQSALELCSSSVFVLRRGGPVSFRGCEGGMF